MKNYALFSFCLLLLFCPKNIVAATAMLYDTISPIELKEHKSIRTKNNLPTMTAKEAENELIRAKNRARKAKNAFIFSILTLGLFYPLALYWLIAAIGPSINARRYYRNFSKDKTLIREAEAVYQTVITILIIHIASLLILLTLGGFFSLFNFDTLNLAKLGVFLAALSDFLFFNIFFTNKWKKK